MVQPLNDNEEALRRLRQISDQVVALRANLSAYPANQLMIDRLDEERKTIMSRYIRAIHG